MAVGNLTPGVALDDRVGHFARLGRIQDLGDLAEIHHAFRRDISLRNADVLHKVNCQRIGGNIHLLDLLQQLIKRAGVFRRADQLIVNIERVAIGHLTELVGKILLEGRSVRHIAAADKGGGIMNGAVLDLIDRAERFGGDALQLRRGPARLRGAAHRIDYIAVVHHGRSHRVKREEQRDRGHGGRAADEVEGIHAPCVPVPALFMLAGGMVALAAQRQQSFVQQCVPHRDHSADDEKHLHEKAVGFGEVARLALAHDRARARADAADPRADRGADDRKLRDPFVQPRRHTAALCRLSLLRGA